jgi:Anti-sigma factor NepR
MGRRPAAGFDFEAVRIAIGAALRTKYSEVLHEPIPDRMAELLRQLDQPPESSQDADKA